MPAATSSTPLMSLSGVVLDTETTGLDAQSARILQIGAVKIAFGELAGDREFERLVNPGAPIPADNSKIHGLYDADVAEAPAFSSVARELEEFIDGDVVIGHSLGFDLSILKNECDRAGITFERPRSLDTMYLGQLAIPTLANYSIEALANWLGITVEGRHTAIGDAVTTARIFLALIPLLRTVGIVTLAEAERGCRTVAGSHEKYDRAGWLAAVSDPVAGSREMASKLATIDSFPFRHRVRDVMTGPPIFAEGSWSPEELGRFLAKKQISSAFITPSAKDEPVGIVTERDLVRYFSCEERVSATVAEIMSAPLISVQADAYVYQAISRMRNLRFRHLGVTDEDGNVVGALTNGDLLKQRAGDAILLGEELDSAQNTAALGAIWARLPVIARKMFDEQIPALDIVAVISEELCAVTRRACEMAEARMLREGRGAPPVPFCLLVLGSGGRGESLLAGDQDNAIVFQSDNGNAVVRDWFKALGAHLSDILNEIGIPYCNGGVMASNDAWCNGIDDWKAIVATWVTRLDPVDLLFVDIFFDFRFVHGDRDLARHLWRHASEVARKSPAFLACLAKMTAQGQPPIGVLGNIRTKGGFVEIKHNTLLNIIGGARMLALRHGVDERSTKSRLDGYRRIFADATESVDSISEAHEILLSAVLEQQLTNIENGLPPSYAVELQRLSKRRRTELKWALRQVLTLNKLIGDPD